MSVGTLSLCVLISALPLLLTWGSTHGVHTLLNAAVVLLPCCFLAFAALAHIARASGLLKEFKLSYHNGIYSKQ